MDKSLIKVWLETIGDTTYFHLKVYGYHICCNNTRKEKISCIEYFLNKYYGNRAGDRVIIRAELKKKGCYS